MIHLIGLLTLGLIISIVAGGIGFWISVQTYPSFLSGLLMVVPICGILAAALWEYLAKKWPSSSKSSQHKVAHFYMSLVLVLLTQFVIYGLWQIRGLPWGQ